LAVSRSDDNASDPVGPELLGRLIDQHAAALELYAAQLCDCPEDVLQQALIDLARRKQAPDQVLAWLYRAVRHRALNARRSSRRRKRHEQEAAKRRSATVIGEPVGDLDAELVTAALEALPQAQREIVVAHLWGGLTFQQIGRLTGTSDSTAHRRYQQALSAIRERLRRSCRETS